MKIVVIGGYAKSLLNFRGRLLSELVNRGSDVHVLAPGLDVEYSVVEKLQKLGVTPHNLEMNRAGLSPYDDLKLVLLIGRILRRIQPDVVFSYTVKPVVWGMIAARLFCRSRRVSLITGLGLSSGDYGNLRDKILRGIIYFLYKFALRKVNDVVFQNKDDLALFRKKRLISNWSRTRVVDGSGVDLDHFKRVPLPKDGFDFVLIARMIGPKGVREFAQAAQLLRRWGYEASFHLVGGIDSNPSSLAPEEINSWHNDGLVVWHGDVEDVRPYIQMAHVVVLPSYYREGVPRSLLEGIAMGRLIITTDMPGCREVVLEGQNGCLVPPRDSVSLARAMVSLMELTEKELLEMSSVSFNLAADRFEVGKINKVMLSVLEGKCAKS